MNEEPTISEEDTLNRHKQEKKDLQAKIQSLKKSVPKGDKKKKKEITDQITQLETELEARHTLELAVFNPASSVTISDDLQQSEPLNLSNSNASEINGDGSQNEESIEGENMDITPSDEGQRVSRAQKRRNRKATEEKEREKRIADQAERNREGPRVIEMNLIKESLKSIGLSLYDVAADGNCLYCAVNHQLDVTGRESYTVSKLRKQTANFMRENKDEFLPFMYNESDEPVSEQYFEDYCKEVANTKLWGGQLELRALSNLLSCPIKVIQANGPPTVQGENFAGPELTLTYHRHLYRLGEHYNSTVKKDIS